MLPAESHWIHTLKPSQFTNEELRVGSFACFAHPRLRPPDLADCMCLFVPTRTAPDARKHWRLGKPGQKLATELCLFVPAPKVAAPRKLLKRFGVPDRTTLNRLSVMRSLVYGACGM